LDYTFLKQLIGMAEEYEQLTGNNTPDFDEFRSWLQSGKKPDVQIDADRVGPEGYGDGHMPGMISQLIVNMYGYAKLYVKKSLEGTELQTVDEFRYMVSLLMHQPLTKTKLIQHNINEKPTGMEIIKRLIKLGYIEERDHEHDKRSKNLFVTEAGRNVLSGLYVKVTKISNLILADLTIPEQRQFYAVLQRMDNFHKPIFLDNLQQVDELLDDDK
jgi:MarR family transcriptional regulator, lower aerobic nicotinate degradation pathway regulator